MERVNTLREKELEKGLRADFETLGGQLYKWRGTVRGIPDRIGFLPLGEIFIIELKVGDNPLSPQQKVIQSELDRLGTEVCVVRNEQGRAMFWSMYLNRLCVSGRALLRTHSPQNKYRQEVSKYLVVVRDFIRKSKLFTPEYKVGNMQRFNYLIDEL